MKHKIRYRVIHKNRQYDEIREIDIHTSYPDTARQLFWNNLTSFISDYTELDRIEILHVRSI